MKIVHVSLNNAKTLKIIIEKKNEKKKNNIKQTLCIYFGHYSV